ncbi:MAG: YIP1 family protein [Deltaproteobacteria bacterium]|nr:YIP1 family protein [Deltaproteobacteria bacterium]MBW2149730.1 YIP1 family protein [Deltaproteobacteria bacterium]
MTESKGTTEANKFSLGFYMHALTGMLGAPGRFFRELPDETGYRRPLGFLLVSSLFLTGASLTQVHERPLLMAGILLVNAIGMPFVTAGVSFMALTMFIGKRVPFQRIFTVYAFSSGVTMLASWIPLFTWITEPWRWVLVSIGMASGCGLNWKQTVLVIGVSILIIVLFFWSLMPVILWVRSL